MNFTVLLQEYQWILWYCHKNMDEFCGIHSEFCEFHGITMVVG